MNVINVVQQCFYDIINAHTMKKCNVRVGNGVRIKGIIFVRNQGELVIGNNVKVNSGKNANVIGGDIRTNILVFNNGKVEIGNSVGMSNCTLVCQSKIIIEDYVMLGGGNRIYDTDFHSIRFGDRIQKPDPGVISKPVIIKEGAFVGAHSIILKGVTIGKHAVVGAGSVVATDIPDNEIWAGNPARFIKEIG